MVNMGMTSVVNVAIGLAVLFLLLAYIIMPNYNTAGNTNITGTGLTSGTYTGILLLVFFLAMIGVALSFWKKG